MPKRMMTIASCLMLLLVACGNPQEGAADQAATSTTAAAVLATTVPVDTTQPAPTTTTTSTTLPPSTTTTTAAPSDDAGSLLGSLDADTPVTSGRIEGSIEMTGLDASVSGISDGVILFSTSFDSDSGDTAFLMDMSSMIDSAAASETDRFAGLAGMMGVLEFRQIGDTVFMRFPFFTAMLGAETEWVSMPAEEGEQFTGEFETMPTDPNEVLDTFSEAGTTVEEVGVEEVNGVTATHYVITLDTAAMELTAEEQAEMAASGLFATGVIPMEIWISDAGHMVRMIMEIDGSGIDAPPEEQFDTMTMRYDFFDINGDVAIEPPPASDVTPVDDLEGAFGLDQ